MKLVTRLMAAAALASGLSACATVTRGTTEEFTIESTPPGAAVKTTNGFTCPATPCTFKMPRKEAFEVTVSSKGYKDAHASVSSQMSGAGAAGMAGNVLVGGLIGVGIDATSGALNDLTPNPLQITLEAVEVAEASPQSATEPVADTTQAEAPAAEPAQ